MQLTINCHPSRVLVGEDGRLCTYKMVKWCRPRRVYGYCPHKKLNLDHFKFEASRWTAPTTPPIHSSATNTTTMLAAKRVQNVCPRCTAQISKFYVNSFVELIAAATGRTVRHATTSSARFRSRRNYARFLSTSARRLRQEPTEDVGTQATPDPSLDAIVPEPAEPENEFLQAFRDLPESQEIETIVRQAKRLFGDTLPLEYLSENEAKLYERLYGVPLRPTRPEDVGFGSFGEWEEEPTNKSKNSLLREDKHGNLEEVENEVDKREAAVRLPSAAQLEYIRANASNQREYMALLQLQQEFEVERVQIIQEEAELEQEALEEQKAEERKEEEQIEQEEEEQAEEKEDEEPDADLLAWYPGHEGPRLHQYTVEGQYRTSPRTVYLPKATLIEPISELLKRTDTKHIRAAAEESFGGPGLPTSPSTYKYTRDSQHRGLGLQAGQHKMPPIDADAFISTAMPGIFATVTSTLVEVRKRLGPKWMRGLLNRSNSDGAGPRVLDVGAGGAALSAWQNLLQTEWDLMRENNDELGALPPGKRTVIVGSHTLRSRISSFLENTQFLPRLPDYIHSVENTERLLDGSEVPQKRKVYDVIIATHTLMAYDKEFRRRETLDNLWSLLSPEGGVLIVLEKGHPRGFEAVAEARQRLLDEYILPPTPQDAPDAIEKDSVREREPGMIVAPCTNHSKCPMYLSPGNSPGRKDFCHFSQRFVRPPFLQRILGASERNHEDINFSFIAVRRGMPAPASDFTASQTGTEQQAESSDILNPRHILQGKAATNAAFTGYESASPDSAARPHPLSLPRNILPPLKRKGHVTLDLCTPSATIERWVVSRSFSKQAYHDARKAHWGDLWALGAKTRTQRSVRLGRGITDGEVVPNDGGVRAARVAALNRVVDSKGRRAKSPNSVVNIDLNAGPLTASKLQGVQPLRPERRTKRGRLPPRERKRKEDDDD